MGCLALSPFPPLGHLGSSTPPPGWEQKRSTGGKAGKADIFTLCCMQMPSSSCSLRLCLWLAAGSVCPRSLLLGSGRGSASGWTFPKPFSLPFCWWGPLIPWQPSWLGISKMVQVRLHSVVFVALVQGSLLGLASPNCGYTGCFSGVISLLFYLLSCLSSSLFSCSEGHGGN